MHTMIRPAFGVPWFDLARHDDDPDPAPDPEPTDPSADPDPDAPDPDPEGADQLGDPGKKALATMKAEKAEARREAAEAKRQAAALAKKVAEFEDRDKSDLEKATAKAEGATARAEAATKRAVLAEVKAQAADLFEDRDDARVNLADKLDSYVGDDGEIDEEAIAADLAAVLEKKPHLRKAVAAPDAPKAPRPDPGQGPRQPTPPTDFRTASREEYEAKLAELGVRPRR
jgi:hypothetical protein